MLGLNANGNGRLRVFGRGVSRWGTLCGAFGLLVFVTGCPRPQACEDDAGCDDGAFCNGAETCNADTGMCDAGTAPCDADTQECDEDNDVCITLCMTDAECDDNNDCTDDACGMDGRCASTPDDTNECDDGDVCTENDACTAGVCGGDAIAGCCTENADCDVAAGETCDTTTNTCTPPPNSDLEGTDAAGNPLATDAAGDPVDFDAVTAGDTVTLTAPDPTATAKRRIFGPRQLPADCTCAWSIDPASAGTFSDADMCTTDITFDEAGDSVITVVVTCPGEDPATFNQDAAAGCVNDGDCDDGLFCNGSETCDTASGDCVAGTEACPDDDTFCNGTESCDEDTDVCSSSGNPCAADQMCDEDTDACVAAAECMVDADCDDGVFCNGAETCSMDTETCVAGTSPCDAATQNCAEGDTAAVCTDIPPVTINFTLDTDNLTGTTGNDTFNAPLIFTTAQFASLQIGDRADGLAGSDTLNAFFNAAAVIVPTSIAGIETFNMTSFVAGATLNAVNVSGVQTINSKDSVANFIVTGLQNVVNGGLVNVTGAGMNLGFATAPTSGNSDVITITLNNADTGIVNAPGAGQATNFILTTAANGFETINLVSEGGSPDNRLGALEQMTGTTTRTLNITGAEALQIQTLIPAGVNGINVIDASGFSGNLTLGFGDRIGGAAPNTFTSLAATNFNNVTGGSGNDTFIFAATFDGNDFNGTSEKLDGGGGTDVVQATFAGVLGPALPFVNVEEVQFNANGVNSSVNLTGVSGLSTVTINGDGTANTFTFLNVSGLPTLNFRGNGTAAAQVFDDVVYTATGATGGSDTLNVTIGNRGTALNTTGTANVSTIGGAAFTAALIETLNVTVTDGPATFNTGITAAALVTLTLTGSSNLTMGTIVGGAANTIVSINAAGVSGDSNFTLINDLAAGAQITLGPGNDVVTAMEAGTFLNGTLTCGAGNDNVTGSNFANVINGGDGNDTITGGAAIDTISTGTGVDRVTFDGTNAAAADADNVSDFTAGASGDVIAIDVSAAGGAVAANLADNALVAVAASANNSFIVDSAGAGFATFLLAEAAVQAANAATLDYALMFFNTTTNVVEIHIDATSNAVGGNVLLASFTNFNTDALADVFLAAFVAANYDSF